MGLTHLRGGEGSSFPERCRAPQFGSTPLHYAAVRGHASVVEQLLAAGAGVDAKGQVREERANTDRGGICGGTQRCVSS
jgi:hypothetical protein